MSISPRTSSVSRGSERCLGSLFYIVTSLAPIADIDVQDGNAAKLVF